MSAIHIPKLKPEHSNPTRRITAHFAHRLELSSFDHLAITSMNRIARYIVTTVVSYNKQFSDYTFPLIGLAD
ncbi:hypothetical protein EG68_07219 [Paragonimus skrjabini miyazakii]|uniref:Uncharacterized protein n=1 Tax=Paragonimus skrjabini miyazakii TaxID=59628 RepID=A0A8S9YQZ8_9TREM|nr:hypothetical protein EG68_07219 [Paragonimus skrjabini miyazakii]